MNTVGSINWSGTSCFLSAFRRTGFSQILAMIEEAAGTRMYECKKISAQKTIEKKEAKLKEIQTV